MSQTERIYLINQMLQGSRIVAVQSLLDKLEISRPTLNRDIALMRDQFNAPIIFDRRLNGYSLSKSDHVGPVFEMPGMWLSPSEAYALITANSLLESIEPGLISKFISPLKDRLVGLISGTKKGASAEEKLSEISERVQVIQSLRHKLPLDNFQSIAYAAINGFQISVCFDGPDANLEHAVTLSPQRITYYRENWFLDAWSHELNALRTYAIDQFKRVHVTEEPAKLLPKAEVDEVLNTGFGAYVGEKRKTAVLDFSPDRARALLRLTWHDESEGTWLENGWYRVSVAYNNERALVKDILRHCPGILVQEPACLKAQVIKSMKDGLSLYSDDKK